MIHTICYFSSATKSLHENDLKSLLNNSKEKNQKNNISGILVYADGNFMQVLEGEETVVNSLYEKILNDQRHYNIIKVIGITYNDRIFEDYNYGFTVIDNKLSVEKLNKYLSWLHNHPSNEINKFVTLMQQFTKNI